MTRMIKVEYQKCHSLIDISLLDLGRQKDIKVKSLEAVITTQLKQGGNTHVNPRPT